MRGTLAALLISTALIGPAMAQTAMNARVVDPNSPPSYSIGGNGSTTMDSNGRLIVNCVVGCGGGSGGSNGSVTAAGVNGTVAQAVQGITGGVPIAITGTISASIAATAGASPPSYTAGAQALSQTLTGGLRVQMTSAGLDVASMPITPASTANTAMTPSTASSTVMALLTPAQLQGYQSIFFGFFGTWVGTLNFQISPDNATWSSYGCVNSGSSTIQTSSTANGNFNCAVPAGMWFRIFNSAFTSGTVQGDYGLGAGAAQSIIPATVGLSAGSAIVGKFGIDQTTPGTTNLIATGAQSAAGTANATVFSIQGNASGIAVPVSSATLGTAANQATIVTALTRTNAGTTATTALPIQGVTGGIPVPVTDAYANITPAAGAASAIVTGGTAITLVNGPIQGGYVVNPCNLAAQGIGTAENAYVDPVAAPGSTDAAANGTTVALQPCQNYPLPPLATGQSLRGNAATTGHKFTVVKW